MKPEKEVRQINIAAKVEKRENDGVGSIVGYPIVYNKDSEDMGFIERIAPGAVKNALKRSDIRGLKNHDPSLIFARQGVNLKLTEDKNGLRFEATPIDTANYRETAKEIEAGLLTGQSFGFTILEDEWKDLDSDNPKRTITEIGEIFDVGPVTYPAYPDTSVGLRSLEKAREDAKETPPEEKITITINDEKFDFTGESRFDDAAEKIKEIRSIANPTIPADDDTDPNPTIEQEPVQAKDETLERINEKIKRYSE